jgi:hypothetical protein
MTSHKCQQCPGDSIPDDKRENCVIPQEFIPPYLRDQFPRMEYKYFWFLLFFPVIGVLPMVITLIKRFIVGSSSQNNRENETNRLIAAQTGQSRQRSFEIELNSLNIQRNSSIYFVPEVDYDNGRNGFYGHSSRGVNNNTSSASAPPYYSQDDDDESSEC